MTDDEIRAIRERADKATKGPWVRGCDPDGAQVVFQMLPKDVGYMAPELLGNVDEQAVANFVFLEYARADVPNLADECLARGRRIAELEAELLRVRTTAHGAAHQLDNIAIEQGWGHSMPPHDIVWRIRERLKQSQP